jgi:hypothetical protein
MDGLSVEELSNYARRIPIDGRVATIESRDIIAAQRPHIAGVGPSERRFNY